MKKLLNLYTIIGFILIINLGTLAVLRFGNPQWNRWIYVFQCYYFPEHKYSGTLQNGKAFTFYEIFLPKGYTGKWCHWRKNGQIKSEVTYLNGSWHGLQKHWYENGQMKSSGIHIKGWEEDKWQFWHSNGHKEKEVVFKKGQEVSRKNFGNP